MQQSKNKRLKRDSKTSFVASHIGERVSMLSPNRSPDTKSKLNAPQASFLKEFKKTKIKLNTLSSIGNLGIEDQIKKEIAQVNDVLKECELKIHVSNYFGSEKQQLIFLQELIKSKDETIKNLGLQIQQLKKNDRNVVEEQSHSSGNKNTTDNSDKERIFKLAEQIKTQKEELSKSMGQHTQRHNGYLKIKKMIEELQQKYTKNNGKNKDEVYNGPPLLSYEQFKEKAKLRKDQPVIKVKKIDFYHQVSQKQPANTSKNMKDLITRKNITLTALKNSRKKHTVEVTQLIAKLDFLKDEDAHLNQKIKQKQQQLGNMQRKFSERKGETHRNQMLHFHSRE